MKTKTAQTRTAKPKPLKLKAQHASEAQIQTALMNRLHAAGWLTLRVNSFAAQVGRRFVRAYLVHRMPSRTGRVVSAGFPDVLALRGALDSGTGYCIDARLFEVKTETGKTSAAQDDFRVWAERHGVQIEVVQGWDAMLAVDVE